MMLVTLAQTKARLRIDYDTDDADYTAMIHEASAMILNYLKSGADNFLDSAGSVITDSNDNPLYIPYSVQSATMLLVGYLDRGRDGDPDKAFSMGELPVAVTAQIYQLRDPALA